MTINGSLATITAEIVILIQTALMARIFTLRGIPLPASKFLIIVPKRGLLINQVWRRSEDLAKQKPDNSTSGTVGRSGTRAPITPSTKDRIPVITSSVCFSGVIIA
jgi:hypothetical protein